MIRFSWVTEFLYISEQHFLRSPQGVYVFLCDWSGSIFVFPSGDNILLSIFNSGSLSFEEAFDVWKSHNVFIVHICCFCLPRSFFPISGWRDSISSIGYTVFEDPWEGNCF